MGCWLLARGSNSKFSLPEDQTRSSSPMHIFLSYRREETSGHAGRLYDALAARFEADHVFMDIDRIEPGLDFTAVLNEAVTSCDALIAVIGSRWLTAADANGRARLQKPDDFVRLELKTALERGVRVIPALVQNAEMPSSDELPDDLRPLALRQGIELSDSRWGFDVGKLIQTLERFETQLAAEREAMKARAEREAAEEARAQQEATERAAAEKARADREAAEREAADRARAQREAAALAAAESARIEREASLERAASLVEVQAEIPSPLARRPSRLRAATGTLRAHSVSALALVGAAILTVGYLVDAGIPDSPVALDFEHGSQWDFALKYLDPYYKLAVWFVWSPIEAFGVALLVATVAVAGIATGSAREAGHGALIGFGLLSVAASVALLGPYSSSAAVTLTALGGLAILGAGVLGAARARPAGLDESPRWVPLAAGIGALFLLASLFLDFASRAKVTSSPDTTGLGDVSEMGYAYWLELAVAVGVAVIAALLAYRVPHARVLVGGLLLAIGLQTALHLSGLLFQLAKFDKNLEHSWRFGGLIGMIGSVLLLVAGSGILLADHERRSGTAS